MYHWYVDSFPFLCGTASFHDLSMELALIAEQIVNPLITNDAYMRQIIACAEVPMTHICIKDEGAHFHGIFGCCERATAWSSSQPIQ